MKKNIIAGILLLSAMQVLALPNLIGRWLSAPMWDRFEKTELEINFKDTVNFDVKVVVDNTDFCDGTYTAMTMSGTYQLQDSLCMLTADTSTFSAIPAPLPGRDISNLYEEEKLIILPSNNSDDVIALMDELHREVFVIYRQK
jgi:hypothetical protein